MDSWLALGRDVTKAQNRTICGRLDRHGKQSGTCNIRQGRRACRIPDIQVPSPSVVMGAPGTGAR